MILIVKRTFILNYKKKLVIAGSISNWAEKGIDQSNCIVINENIQLPVQEINEVLIGKQSYIAFAFDLDTVNRDLIQDILELNEEQKLRII